MKNNYLVSGPVTQEMIRSTLESLSENMNTGGHSVFIGQVRADSAGTKRVIAIEYSAYDPMAETEADKIVTEIYGLFPDVKKVTIIHSVGVVMAGRISLFVMISAGHRQQAIKACSQAVEMIKEKLPVWKKEIFEDNTHEWKYNHLA
jgi:molybdopterin synthase catalytic subunit